jgi:phage N-6-adenine-methyltransferase
MINAGMYSSKTDMWATPQGFFDKLNDEFGFETDVCATPENAKCKRYFTQEENGLKQEWSGRCWMNPPYGRGIGEWIKKAYESAKRGGLVVCLLPARTDTAWGTITVITSERDTGHTGRFKFGTSKNAAPFPSAICDICGRKNRQGRND